MLAPKAAKSDKGQIGSDQAQGPGGGSSSEFSEDDTPLMVRLNSQGTNRLNDTGKQRSRPFLSNKGAGFVIPRKKKQTNELLQVSNLNSRDGKELLRNVEQSYRDPAVGATFKFEKLELVHNDQLSREYQERKQCMRNECRNPRELEDKHAFLYTLDHDEAKKICEVGVEVGSTSISCLGDPSMGVYLCRHADVISRKPLPLTVLGYLIVFKVVKGKVKPVTERTTTAITDLLEPTPNFDCHVSRSIQSLPANTPLNQVFEYSQYYFYEFAEDGDDLHLKRPRQCLPYAVITFSLGDSSTVHQELSVTQDEMPSVENNGLVGSTTSVLRQDTRILEKRRGRTSHVLWMGKIANKDRILADAQLVCHSLQKIKLPFEIGDKIVMKEKISFQQLRPFLTFPLFHAGPPSISKMCKASVAGDTSFFLHCDLLPVKDDHGKIDKLVKFFQEKNWAGIVKCPDANRVIFLIPTSQITLDLGITTLDSPAALHVLLFVKKQKTNKGNASSKTAAKEKDSQEVKTVFQIQNELKRHFSDVRETPSERRGLSLDSTRPKLASTSGANKMTQDSFASEYAKELTNEQTASWKNAVEDWLRRPCPLSKDQGLQCTVTDSSVKKAEKSVAEVPKTREPPALMSLEPSIQDENVRPSGSTERQKLFPVKRVDDGASRQLKSNKRISKQDNRASVAPLAIKKVEHREDPRLKRHSVDTEPSSDSQKAIMGNYSMPYNAQEASLAQGVASTSVPTSSTIRPLVKYQVNGESLKTLLDKLQLPKQGDSGNGGYQINLDDGTRRALEILKQQEESKKRVSDTQDCNVVAMDSKADGKLVVAVTKSDEKSIKKSNVSATQDKDKKTTTDRVGTVGENLPKPPVQEQAKKHSENRKKRQKPAENLEKKRAKLSKEPEKPDPLLEKPEKPVVQSAVPELSEDPFPAISSESLESLKSPPSKSNWASKAPKLKLILSKNKASAGMEVGNRESSEGKLTEQPEETNSLQDDRDKSMPDDAKICRKSIESPVAMDISPQHTIPDSVSPISVVSAKGRYNLGTAPCSVARTTPVNSTSSVSSTIPFSPPLPQGPYRSPISSVPPPPPPLPPPMFGPSSTPPSSASFSSVPGVHPISSIPSSAPMPFVSPSQAGPVFPTTSVIPLAPPVTPVSSRMGPSATSVPPGMGSPITSIPSGIRPPSGSPSFPVPPPPACPGNMQRKSSLDSLPNAASSSPGVFPSTFSSRQQWTSALSQSQGFEFHPPHPGSVNMPPAVLSRPALLPTIARTHLPGQTVDTPLPQRLGFVPIGAPRFPVLPGTSQGMPFVPPHGPHLLPPVAALTQLVNITGTSQMTPIPPMFGAPAQFMPHIPFQQPVGFWEAPLRPSAVPTSNVGKVPLHHSLGQKHLPVLSSMHKSRDPGKPHSKKNLKAKNDGGDEMLQRSNLEQNKNSGDSDLKDDCSVDKPSTQLDKQPVLSMSDVSEDDDPKSQQLKLAGSAEKKSTDNGMLKNEAVKQLSFGSVKQPKDTEEAGTRDLNKTQLSETHVQEPEKLTSESMLTLDSVCSKSKQNVDGTEEKLHSNDSTKDSKFLVIEDGAEIRTRKTVSDDEPPNKKTVEESHTNSHHDTPGVSDDYFSTTQNSEQIVQENMSFSSSSSITGYLTEAEQTSTKAVSKIFDILRRNAQDSRSETDTTDQEPDNADKQDERDKSDNPDYKPDADVDEGVTKEEKLLFSGEESATSQQSTHLESGLRIVQLLDLSGSESEKEKEKSIKKLSLTVSGKQDKGDIPRGELLGESSEESRKDGLQKKHHTSLSKNSRWEDISEESDEGTPERDLPGLVDIEFKQLWPKTADTTHNTVTESTAAPVKPKTEVVSSEADSSTPTIKSYVTVPSQKRRRQNSTTEGSDTEELKTPPKRRKPETRKRRRHRESSDKHSSVDSTKKTNMDRQRTEEKHQRSKKDHPREENLPSRIVSDTRGGILKITILQDPHSNKEKKIKKELELSETMEDEQLSEQKKPLTEIEYSDLEDISPGRLSSETERPLTPDTPETATPAHDFTHPSLGFWAKPPVSVAAPVAMVTEELQASETDVLAPVTRLSYLDDQSHSNIEQSRGPFDMKEGSIQEDVAHVQISWPVKEGFFCQTTTSEERDLELGVSGQSEILGDDAKEESYLTDDRHYSLSLQESEEDPSRYSQEFPQSKVFKYGHGQGNKQHNPHRSSGYTDSRSMHKGYKHHSATRESRYYPWKARGEGTHSQMASTGGEVPKPSDQSATGKSIGSEKSRVLDDNMNAVKRCKLEKGAHSTKHDNLSGEKTSFKKTSHIESIETDQPKKWEIMVFAWMDKFQFSNWLRRKQHGAKLSSDAEGKTNSVQYTPESVWRSSERLFRRVKRQIRQSSRSCSKSPQLEDMQTYECPEFNFDDLDLESHLHKGESNSCVSNELSQDCIKDAADNVHSYEHASFPCTVDSQIVHRNIDDACKEADHIDQICDNEVSVLLESSEIEEQPTGRILDEEKKDAADAGTEQLLGQLLKDQAIEYNELDIKRSMTSDAEVERIHRKDTTIYGSTAKLFDPDPVVDEGQSCVDLGTQEHNKIDPGRIINCEVVDGGNNEQHPVACSYSLNDVEVTGGVTLSLNSQHDQDAKETQKEVKGVARSGEQSLEVASKDTVTENVQETAQSSCEGVIVNTGGNDSQVGKNALGDKDACLSGKLGEKEVDQESPSCDPVSAVVTEKGIGEMNASGLSQHQNNMDLELNEQCSAFGDSDKAHITTQAVDDKAYETNTTHANSPPFVVTSVMSSDQLSNYLLTANVATSQDAGVNDVWPHSTSLTLSTTPLSVSITTHYPVLPSPPPNFMWPGIGLASPFPTAGMVPALPTQSYGFPSWVEHAPHVPFPVACVKPPALSDDICPPGTENEQSSKVTGSGDVGENTDDSQPHGSVMDHSTVTALMQFYSEISEVEGSDNANNKQINESTETQAGKSVQKPPEVAEIKEHAATSEMEMGSDLEGSMVDVAEEMDVPEVEGSDKPIPESGECFDGHKKTEVESTEISNKQSLSAKGVVCSTMDVTPVEDAVVEKPVVCSTLSSSVNVMPIKNTGVSSLMGLTVNTALPVDVTSLTKPGIGIEAMHVESIDMPSPLSSTVGTPLVESPGIHSSEAPEEVPALSPIDPAFFANAEHTIFSSIGDLKNLLGQSLTFDRIAEDAIASTISSLEDVLRQAQNSYLEFNSCPSDSGLSAGEEVSIPSKSSGILVPISLLQESSNLRTGYRPEENETSHSISKVAEKQSLQKKPQKFRKKFHFFVYSPEHDRECEAVKNYMLKGGGVFVDIKDSACLGDTSHELKVLIRRKHLPSVHRLTNLYRLKMAPFVKFSLFSTLTDVTEGSRLYENIFVSGGALLADDIILKTIEIEHLDGLLRYLKDQSLTHQKFVWVLNVSRNGYKKLSMNRPLTKRDSKVLNLLRHYRDEGFVTVLPKGYVTEGIPATQRYLQTSLKLQIELISVYRHIILLSDMDKNRVEVPWFLERGIGVMNVQEFLTTFAGESEAKNLLVKRPQVSCYPEATSKESSTVMECYTPEDDTACPTPEDTLMSDSSTDSPITNFGESGVKEQLQSATTAAVPAPQKRGARSLSWDTSNMTQTRLQILSCVRSVRDDIRNQISTSSPSSPVSRSM